MPFLCLSGMQDLECFKSFLKRVGQGDFEGTILMTFMMIFGQGLDRA